jgi:hypothetical protein
LDGVVDDTGDCHPNSNQQHTSNSYAGPGVTSVVKLLFTMNWTIAVSGAGYNAEVLITLIPSKDALVGNGVIPVYTADVDVEPAPDNQVHTGHVDSNVLLFMDPRTSFNAVVDGRIAAYQTVDTDDFPPNIDEFLETPPGTELCHQAEQGSYPVTN